MVSVCVGGCGRLFITIAVRLVHIRFITRVLEGHSRSVGPAESGSGYISNNAREPILIFVYRQNLRNKAIINGSGSCAVNGPEFYALIGPYTVMLTVKFGNRKLMDLTYVAP